MRIKENIMSKSSPFKIEQQDHTAWLILDRPGKRNSMDFDFLKEMVECFNRFDEDPDVRVVIIKGEGKSFTAGLDLMALGPLIKDGGADARERLRETIMQGQESMNAIERCRKPVIAAVHSHCIGGGIDMLSACDIRIATRDALFSIRETRIGVIADAGTLQRLPYIIGHGYFRELALTGRDFTANEALQMGFITHISEDRDQLYDHAAGLASDIAACPPLTVQGTKDVILYSRDNGIYPGLQYVAQKNAAALKSEDLMEAVTAFMEKRKPVYQGK